MSKYIDAEKLLSFVKDLEYIHPYVCENLYDNAYSNCLQEVKDFISSHLKEQPEVDLEKEIIRFLPNSAKMNKGEWRGKYAISEIGFRAVAHHFYELGLLGLNARKENGK